jgi:hypothetical protein
MTPVAFAQGAKRSLSASGGGDRRKDRKMERISGRVSLVLTLLTLLALTSSALAQDPPKDMVAFKATISGGLPDVFVVGLNPPLGYGRVAGQGQASDLGSFTYTEHHTAHLDFTGIPRRVTDAVGVMTAANGDAIFLSFSGLVQPVTDGLTGQMAFTIAGGRGRFAGATGSGAIAVALNSVKKEMVCVLDGVISRPR